MSQQENCFTPFKESIASYSLPERFTFPFYYQPHPLCLLAAKELQDYLLSQKEWQHNFGLSTNKAGAIGKMFGVLLVQDKNNEIGYLTAFSGKLAGSNHIGQFVPPVFDLLQEDGFFLAAQAEINQLTEQLHYLQKNPQILEYELILKNEKEASLKQTQKYRDSMIAARKARKAQRISAEIELDADAFFQLKEQLSRQSIQAKNQLKELTTYWHKRIAKAQKNLDSLTDELMLLKNQRKNLSAALQQKIFQQYRFLDIRGQQKSLHSIFINTTQSIPLHSAPPAGAGECATPKLLQYAYTWQMKPLAMAEFWWGASPKSEIRKHQHFYPACHGKCRPILKHMLHGVSMDDNPLLNNPAQDKTIDIVYQDNTLLVINKPAGLLSVPGRDIEDSVYLRIKQSYPHASGPLIVHRLDMLTSGLMVLALTKDAHKNLQKQFIQRTIKKRYIALLDGILSAEKGFIDLPLRVDLDDRPRQLVCYEHGKPAQTQWQLIESKNEKSRVYFYPVSGRTHQLRVHAAHFNGLNTPIVGDDLYGHKADRLYLHAETLEFRHPVSKELMHFQTNAEF